jgi:ABC-type protease/lipase transport system fused ATPase/permease subunit
MAPHVGYVFQDFNLLAGSMPSNVAPFLGSTWCRHQVAHAAGSRPSGS